MQGLIVGLVADEVQFKQVCKVHRVLVALLVLLVHHEVKARVFQLGVVQNADEVACSLVRIGVIFVGEKGVNFDVLDTAGELTLVDLVRELLKIEAALVRVLEHLVVLVLFHPLLFGRLLLLARYIRLRIVCERA